MSRKKVLIDLYSLEYPTCGFGQIAINYAERFAEIQRAGKENFDICFLLPKSFKGKYEGVKCYYPRSTKHWWHRLKWRFPNVDVWHSINQFTSQMPRYSHTKRIFTIHDYNFLVEETEEKQEVMLRKMQQQIDKSDVITFISQYTEDVVREHSNIEGKQTALIYDGVESLVDKPMVKPTFVNGNRKFFFALGQFYPKKKFAELLDVMKYFPDMDLYICGQNNLQDTDNYGPSIIKRIADEHITNVHTPGPISNEERVWMFANCDAYLFPSIGEGFGLPAIEAMQFGKPVFASKYQSLPEIVGGHGYLWGDFNPEHMAKVIQGGLSDFYANDAKAQEVIEYAKSFSYEKHIEAYLKIYRQLLGVDEGSI